jgi:DNA-binding SARP family transcriptional activator
MANVTLLTLGGCRVEAGREAHQLSPLELWVLAYLTSKRNGRVSKEELLLLLWDGATTARARHSLCQSIHRLRKNLPNLRLHATRQDLVLDLSSVDCDATQFEAAYQRRDFAVAARLYGGSFLEGHLVTGRRKFQFWLEQRAATLAHQARDVFLHLARQAEAIGSWNDVEVFAQRLAQVDPLDPTAGVLLASARAAQGDKRAALEILGRIKHRDRRYRTGTTARSIFLLARRFDQLQGALEPGATHPTAFVGRADEIRRLRRAWDEVTARPTCGFVLLSGEAGIGKSRLLEHMARLITIRGGRALIGRCRELERRMPYAGLVDLLSNNIRPADLRNASQIERDILSTVAPTLDLPRLTRSRTIDPLPPLAVFDSVVSLFRHLSTAAPLLVQLDDAHWADEGTLMFLQYAARRLRETPVLFLIAIRQEDMGHAHHLSASIADWHASQHIMLGPLDDKAALELIEKFGGTTGLVLTNLQAHALANGANGRPLFIIECMREALPFLKTGDGFADFALGGRTSTNLREHVTQRLAKLTTRAREVVASIAVLNARATIGDLAAILELPDQVVVESLQEGENHALLQRTDPAIGFTHDLLRQSIYASLPLSLRLYLHARIADYLARQRSVSDGVLADHYAAAGQGDNAFAYSLRAAIAAIDAAAFADAEHYVDLASASATDAGSLLAVADLRFRLLVAANRSIEACSLIERLKPWFLANRNTDGLLRISMVRLLAGLAECDDFTLLQRHVDEFSQMLDVTEDLSLAAQYVTNIAAAAHHCGRADVIAFLLPRLGARGHAHGAARGRAEILSMAARLHCVYGAAEPAWSSVHAAELAAKESGDAVVQLVAASARGVTELIYGHIEASRIAYSLAYAMCTRPELARFSERVVGDYGWVLMECGLVDEARSILGDAIRRLSNHRVLYAFGNLCGLYCSTREWLLLSETASRLLDANSVLRAEWAELAGHSFRGIAALELGSTGTVREAWEAVSRLTIGTRRRAVDSWITVIFTGKYLRNHGLIGESLNVLTHAVEECLARDRLARWRFELEIAEAKLAFAPSESLRLCHGVQAEAAACGALQIARCAKRLKACVVD